jgi:phage terminase large subunit GpA-like protein
MNDMPDRVPEGAVDSWPVGIHWQVAQACTLQNIHISMPEATEERKGMQHRGIFMENGSGGTAQLVPFTAMLVENTLLITVL